MTLMVWLAFSLSNAGSTPTQTPAKVGQLSNPASVQVLTDWTYVPDGKSAPQAGGDASSMQVRIVKISGSCFVQSDIVGATNLTPTTCPAA